MAVASAFAWSIRGAVKDGPTGGIVQLRIHPAALATVVGFPGVIGSFSVGVAMSRSLAKDGASSLGVGLLALAVVLLILGLGSRLRIDKDTLAVRFFGLRSTTIRFDELESATFVMGFPSISFAIALRDRHRRKALVHANWWSDEGSAVRPLCQALVHFDVAMDRSTARVVSKVLRIKRPQARILPRMRHRKNKTG